MIRDDISPNLVHFTRGGGDTPAARTSTAMENLTAIIRERRLIGGTGYIRGSHRCVCFSEAPVSKLAYLLAEGGAEGQIRYAAFGAIVPKVAVYEAGGRPVIYGPYDEYDSLPDAMQYRHVRFHLGDRYSVDYTWEREWRIRTDAFPLRPEEVTVVLPDRSAKNELSPLLQNDWNVLVLADLGVNINAA
jgi:hypothetical protein